MTQKIIVETRQKLDELEQRIHAARNSIGAAGNFSAEAQKDWDDMVAKHSDIRRKLDAQSDHPVGVIEGLRYDVDSLSGAYEKWVAKIEGKFNS